MYTYITRRFLQIIIVILCITIFSFILTVVIPGNAVLALIGPEGASEEYIQYMEHKLGIDQPIHIRYYHWFSGVITGKLGISSRTRQPVALMLWQRLPVTIELILMSVVISVIVSLFSALISVRYYGSWPDNLILIITSAATAIPRFWIGMMLMLVFSVKFRILPSGGFIPISDGIGKNLSSMIMPVIALTPILFASLTRQLRSSMIEQLQEDYTRTARSKGVKESVVLRKHVLRNALIPSISVLGLTLGRLVGGSVIIEVVFSLPGVGKLIMDGLLFRDIAVVQIGLLILGTSVCFMNFVADLMYAVVDPRIRYK